MMSAGLRVLMVDGAPPHRDASAGERATFDLIDGLHRLGHSVTFTSLGVNESHQMRSRLLVDHGVHVAADYGTGTSHLRALLQEQAWDVVIVHRPGPALAALPCLIEAGDAATLFWGHDIHTWRLQAQVDQGLSVPRHRLLVTEVSERRCWDGYDLTVYPSAREAKFVSGRPTSVDRGQAFPYYRLTNDDLVSDVADEQTRRGCLMVGGSSHEPNRDAVEYAVNRVLPLLQAQDPNAFLTVVGTWSTSAQEALMRDGVTFVGHVSDDELRRLHTTHVCLLAPLRFGAGTRRKLVAAMGLGLPTVTTAEGVRGLLVRDATEADGVLVADDPQQIVAAVTSLQQQPELWKSVSGAGRDAVASVYGAAEFDAALSALLSLAGMAASRRRAEGEMT